MAAGRAQATVRALALTLALEAACIAVPFALGDRIAVWAALLRTWDLLGFYGLVFGWTLIMMVVVFPTAFVSGFQFPLIISLMGRGRRDVGRHTGMVYAWNTAGAVGGVAGRRIRIAAPVDRAGSVARRRVSDGRLGLGRPIPLAGT